MPRILLYSTSNPKGEIYLNGVRDGDGNFGLQSLEIAAPGAAAITYLPPAGIRIPAGWQSATGVADDYVLQQSTADFQLLISIPLAHGTGDLPFLGRKFSASAGYALTLNINVTAAGMAMPAAYCSIHVCGVVDAAIGGGGASAFLDASICCELSMPQLPKYPTFQMPKLRINLPDVGFEWPEFELSGTGGFPQLPTLPWNFGWPSLELPSLFLKLSWQKVTIAKDGQATIIDVTGLRFDCGTGRILEIDLHIAIANSCVTTDSWLEYYPKDAGHTTRLGISHWYQSEESTVIGWKGRQLENWLALLLPEFMTPDLPDDCDIALRLLREDGALKEVRLDYVPPNGSKKGWDITLPGFIASFPVPEFYSLVVWQAEPDAEDVEWRLGLFGTLPQDASLKGHTTFAAGDGSEPRRLHGDDSAGSEELVELEVKVLPARLSLAVLDVPLGAGRPYFFRKARTGIVPFDWSDTQSLEMPSVEGEDSLQDSDVLASFKLNTGQLPFLKQNGSPALAQYIEVTPGDGRVDFVKTQFDLPLEIKLHLGALTNTLQLDASSNVDLLFNWENFAFDLTGAKAIDFTLKKTVHADFLGLSWVFENAPGGALFQLVLDGENFSIRQAKGSKIEAHFTKITSPSEPLIFQVENFVLGPRGLSIDASMKQCHARLNGVATQFEFKDASFQVRDNKITGFTVSGSGPLPPALVGDASADVALQFGAGEDGSLQLLSAGAALKGRNLLHCQSTRFELSIDGLGLRFINESGDYHLYFTVTGTARFKPIQSDDSEGPLAWLPKIEMQFVDCPLAGDGSVLKNHISFNVEMPRKVAFSFLGCFSFELRGLGFVPEVDFWDDKPAAMLLCGQIKFAVDGGDVVDARFDFHNLYVALPEPGSFVPRLRCRDLGLKLRAGESFEMEGMLDFIEGEEIEPGWRARGFRGHGAVTIMGLPKYSATFAFLRVLQPKPTPNWVRAWFIYTEVAHLSLRIPAPIPLFIREVGLGFGYRYTLATLKSADELDDIKTLIRELNRLSASAGNLSDLALWKLDVETPPQPPRYTLTMRGMISTASASTGATDWHPKEEQTLANVLLMDVVMALRSDLSFYVNVRTWLYTNYRDFDDNVNEVRNHPLHTGYALFQPRKSRLLAHVGSSDDPRFGEHPPVWDFLKQAIQSTRYSATLLIEPGLFHLELGWPNVLRWQMHWGPFNVECRGGAIIRITPREMVQGLSYEARGNLSLKAEFGSGPVGARLWADARLSFGARFIVVLGLDRADRSAFYGAVGLEISVQVGIALWIRISYGFGHITLDFSFSFELGFSALLEVGASLNALPGCRGTADVSLRLCGRGVHFHIHVGINEAAVDRAYEITKGFLNVGLEATEVEPLPGENLAHFMRRDRYALRRTRRGRDVSAKPASRVSTGHRPAVTTFVNPEYDIVTVPFTDAAGTKRWLLALVPSGRTPQGFASTPPDDTVVGKRTSDYQWDLSKIADADFKDHVVRLGRDGRTQMPSAGVFDWKVEWQAKAGETKQPDNTVKENYLYQLLRHAYIAEEPDREPQFIGDLNPFDEPEQIVPSKQKTDERVQNPSDQNFEAAVRGTIEQFKGSPYLRHDPSSEFEQMLIEACQNYTSIYSADGQSMDSQAEDGHRQATELRSTIFSGLVEDVKKYADLLSNGADVKSLASFRESSVAFALGLIFQADREPGWMKADGPELAEVGTIAQCLDVLALKPSSKGANVKAFNTRATSFGYHPPKIDNVRQYASASSVAIAWDASWDVNADIDDHLRHYFITRQAVGGEGITKSFFVKPAAVLLREENGDVVSLPARFQFVDHFKEESAESISDLPPEGRTYLYTITPVDLSGENSRRSLTLSATRFPSNPPSVPTGSTFTVHYNLTRPEGISAGATDPSVLFKRSSALKPLVPAALRIALPAPKPDETPAKWRLVLRRERTLPIGSYPADSATDSPRLSAPASMARPLATDVKIELPAIGNAAHEGKIVDTDDGRFFVWTINDLSAVPGLSGIFPVRANLQWQPAAWRVFIQAESDRKVPSSLAPAELTLQFCQSEIQEFGKATGGFELRHPELLEWILRPLSIDFLDARDGQANPGMATVPRPFAIDDKTSVALQLPKSASKARPTLDDQPIQFRVHPKQWRAAHLRWNHAPASVSAQLRELAASYRMFEFDADEHAADLGKVTTATEFLDLVREVREMRLLPPGQIRLVPAENLAPDTWEAWYPSTARREFINSLESPTGQNARRDDRRLSPWFSWKDSYLRWPPLPKGWADIRQNGNSLISIADAGATLADGPHKDTFSITLKPAADVDKDEFERQVQALSTCAWLDISGLSIVSHNGLKLVVSVSGSSFEFYKDQFSGLDLTSAKSIVISQPRADAHWFLQYLVRQVEAEANETLTPESTCFFGTASDPSLIPPGKAKDLDGFFAETSRSEDPYGWNALKRLGLSCAVIFRKVRSGEPLPTEEVWRLVQKVLVGVREQVELCKLIPYLHVELLFQPGRSVRLDTSPDDKPNAKDDLLALIQFSLRPTIQQHMAYHRVVLLPNVLPGDPEVTVEIKSRGEGPTSYIVESDGRGGTIAPKDSVSLRCMSAPAKDNSNSQSVSLLLRYALHEEPEISAPGWKATSTVLPPAASEPVRFSDLTQRWYPAAPDEVATNPSDVPIEPVLPEASVEWDILAKYMRAAGVTEPAELAPFTRKLNQPETLGWLTRFFTYSGDFPTAGTAGTEFPAAGNGPWLATAYPQANTQLFATPLAGRLDVHQLIDDGWGHGFRYFALPVSRYDLLWTGLAQSAQLYPAVDQRKANANLLLEFGKPKTNEGGLDISLPRIRRLAPPLVLGSRRLDAPGADGPIDPSPTWEVIVAKHNEQKLSERNRSLARRLEFQHIAWAMLRRFAFSEIRDLLSIKTSPVAERYEGRISGDATPNIIEVPEYGSVVKEQQRMLMIPDRIDPFAHDAVALQWRHLPFFYEHRLVLEAHAGHAVSPKVSVTQHDFAFRSPKLTAVNDALIEREKGGSRYLAIDVRLARLWDAVPQEVQSAWDIENPDTPPTEIRPAAVPDPEITYDLLNIGSGGEANGLPVTDTLAVLTFQRDEKKNEWAVRPVSSRFESRIVDVIGPPSADGGRGYWKVRLGLNAKLSGGELIEPVRSRYDLSEADRAAYDLDALAPSQLVLAYHGTMTPAHEAVVRSWIDKTDASLAAALTSLILAARDQSSSEIAFATASAGLDQIEDVYESFRGRLTIDTEVSPHMLRWQGYLNDKEKAALEAWLEVTPWHEAVSSLIAAMMAEYKIALTSKAADPGDLPAGISLSGGMQLIKQGGLLAEAAMAVLQNPPNNWEPPLQEAARTLYAELQSTEISIADPSFRWRPTSSDAAAKDLQEVLLLARSRLSAKSWLTFADTKAVLMKLKGGSASGLPILASIRRLYAQGYKSALPAGKLTLRCRRSVANSSPAIDVEFAEP